MEVLLFTKYIENNGLGKSLGKKAEFNFLVQQLNQIINYLHKPTI